MSNNRAYKKLIEKLLKDLSDLESEINSLPTINFSDIAYSEAIKILKRKTESVQLESNQSQVKNLYGELSRIRSKLLSARETYVLAARDPTDTDRSYMIEMARMFRETLRIEKILQQKDMDWLIDEKLRKG